MRRFLMGVDRRPPQRSLPTRLTRRDALGLAAAVAVGGLAAATARAAAADDGPAATRALPASAGGPQEAPWAAELTAVVPTAMASIRGAIVGVWQEGQPDYVRAFGVQDTATGVPMTPDLYMRIGS